MNILKNSLKGLLIFCLLIFSVKSFATETELGGIGAQIKKDGKKVFIIKVLPNSPAEKALLKDCTQILKVEDQNVKKLSSEEITNIIRGEIGTPVKLLIKDGNEKKEITVIRGKVNIPQIKDEKFLLHWKQVAPENYQSLGYLNNSSKYSFNLQREIKYINYWERRKDLFKTGYDACLTYPKNDQSACLINLVDREVQRTESQRQAELQRQAIQQQNMYMRDTNMQLLRLNNSLNRW